MEVAEGDTWPASDPKTAPAAGITKEGEGQDKRQGRKKVSVVDKVGQPLLIPNMSGGANQQYICSACCHRQHRQAVGRKPVAAALPTYLCLKMLSMHMPSKAFRTAIPEACAYAGANWAKTVRFLCG